MRSKKLGTSSASSSKMRVLSELNDTRNIIKSKFRQAYADRLKRERNVSEIMKPITSSIDDGFERNINAIKNVNSSVVVTPYKPSRFAASTPLKGILRKTRRMKKRSKAFFRLDNSDDHDDVDDVGDGGNDDADDGGNDDIDDDDDNDTFHTFHDDDDEKNPNFENYTYEPVRDNDKVDNYKNTPDDNLKVFGTKTHKDTGAMTPFRMNYRNLPEAAKTQWSVNRREIADRYKIVIPPKKYEFGDYTPKSVSRVQDKDNLFGITQRLRLRDSRKDINAGGKKRDASKSGGAIKAAHKELDFNFIPYNADSRIIYEYFDDPNELCDRLKLLISSRAAGNTNHMQEINSIIEELRELECIA